MARKVVTLTTLIDDLDGKPIEEGQGETIRFALDGSTYEIDVNSDNAKALREAFKPFVKAARPVSGRRSSGGGSSGNRNSKEELAAARAWLRDSGHAVSDRGRIPSALMEMYRAAK
jgi:nucleoid-associated protein Lsr2